MLSWENITLQQFQQVYELTLKPLDDMQKLEGAVAVLFNKTEKEVEQMSMQAFAAKAKECAFVLNNSTIPGKPVRYITVRGRRYFINYNPAKLMGSMRHRQYVEALHFGDKMIPNLHFIMASLVQRVRFGCIRQKNTASAHAAIADDMLHARFIDVYHAGVFFCKLYINSMKAIKGCLAAEMKKEGKSAEQIALMETALASATDGFTQRLKLHNSNA